MENNLIIKNGLIFDGINGDVKPNHIIEIENGVIKYVGNEKNVSNDYKVIDAQGKFIMPGIIDCHVHIGGMRSGDNIVRIIESNILQGMVAVGQAAKTVEHGVTTVCDVSQAGVYLSKLIDDGEIKGPRIMASGQGFAPGGGGPYVDPDGFFSNDYLKENHPWFAPCDGADNMRHGVRMRAKYGCDAIKIWTTGGDLGTRQNDTDRMYTDEEITAVCEEATMAGMPVLSHCESIQGTKAALRCGVRGIIHGVELDDECNKLFIENNAWLIPTLKNDLDWSSPEEELQTQKRISKFEGDTLQEKMYNMILLSFQNAHKGGVKIALGSDTYCTEDTPYGELTLDEIKTYVNVGGISINESLLIATRNAAEALDIDDRLGTIEKGKFADILIFNEDVSNDINSLCKDNINVVIKDGEIVI